MNDMNFAMSYEVAREQMADATRRAEKARQAREATSRKADEQIQEFRPTSAIDTLRWAVSRWGSHALPSNR